MGNCASFLSAVECDAFTILSSVSMEIRGCSGAFRRDCQLDVERGKYLHHGAYSCVALP